jgi:hypothetical protein
MSEHYHDVGDLRFLIVRREDGAIVRKYRELIALGVASTNAMPVLHRRKLIAAACAPEEHMAPWH